MEKIDYNQCINVVSSLNNYYKDKSKLANIDYPESIKFGSQEYFIYIFYSCLLDYGMRSKIYHKNLIKTYENFKEIFNPRFVLEMETAKLSSIIVNNIHPRYPKVALNKWLTLSASLSEIPNILDTLKSFNDFESLESFIRSIKGYGQKTGGLLIRTIYDSKVCNFGKIKSIPIDRHDIEISYLSGIISKKDISSKEIKELSDAFVLTGEKLNINPSDIDKYLWELGNSFCNNQDCLNCPLYSICKNPKGNINK